MSEPVNVTDNPTTPAPTTGEPPPAPVATPPVDPPPPQPPIPTIDVLRSDVAAIDTTFAELSEAETRLERQTEELTNMRANLATHEAAYDATLSEVTTKFAAYTAALGTAAARRSIALPPVGGPQTTPTGTAAT